MKGIPNPSPKRKLAQRFLLAAAGLATLVAGYYALADWRGQQAWQKCKRDLAAHGESWDWAAYAPAPVPDDENIFKAPKMADWFGDNRPLSQAPLEKRVTNSFAQRFTNPASTREIKTAKDAASYVAWSDQFNDDFATIRAALQRPSARLTGDYSHPDSIVLPNVATMYAVVKTLTQRAKCELILGRSDDAWTDLTLLHDLSRMILGQGKFMTTEGDWMVREEGRHCLQVIAKGTELHAWQDWQLAALEKQLGQTDYIAQHAEALKCGRALLLNALDDGDLVKISHTLAPRGLAYESLGGHFVPHMRDSIDALAPPDGILHPAQLSAAFAYWKRAQQGLPMLLRVQTLVNEGRVACALERYRLAHRDYPETPDALVPQFIDRLPRDLVNGHPFIYRRMDDSYFLLYSVGWNETDDGGKIDASPAGLTSGDWVWKSYMF